MMRRLPLWDVDGTLISGGGVGSAAINEAAATVLVRHRSERYDPGEVWVAAEGTYRKK